jgi:hypothetical protein
MKIFIKGTVCLVCIFLFNQSTIAEHSYGPVFRDRKTRTTIYRLHGAGWDDVLNYPRGFAASNTVNFEKKI